MNRDDTDLDSLQGEAIVRLAGHYIGLLVDWDGMDMWSDLPPNDSEDVERIHRAWKTLVREAVTAIRKLQG